MSSFSRFQDINQKRGMANQQTNSGFIIKGYPSILIKNVANDEELSASVVNRQEKDLAYIYTHIKQPVEVGSVWEAKGLKWLVSEEIVVIKDVSWHKYMAFLCNVQVNGQWGYFISPEKRHVDTVVKEKVLLQSQQHPLLVLGSNVLLIGDKIKINNRAWMVQEKDDSSSRGVAYYSLIPTTMNESLQHQPIQDTVVKPQINNDGFTFIPNQPITISTSDGFFQCDVSAIEVISRSENEVVFKVPFGIDSVQISVIQEDRFMTYTYNKEF